MAPDSFDGVRVHVGSGGIHEALLMAHRHTIQESAVAAPFVGEDNTVCVGALFYEWRESVFRAIGDGCENALSVFAGHASYHPLKSDGNGFIPFREAGKPPRFQFLGHRAEDSVHALASLLVHAKEPGEVSSRCSRSQAEELCSLMPLAVCELAAALHGIRSADERAETVRAFVPCSPAGIFAMPVCTGSTAEAAENCSCRLGHGDERKRKPKAILSSHTQLVGYRACS